MANPKQKRKEINDLMEKTKRDEYVVNELAEPDPNKIIYNATEKNVPEMTAEEKSLIEAKKTAEEMLRNTRRRPDPGTWKPKGKQKSDDSSKYLSDDVVYNVTKEGWKHLEKIVAPRNIRDNPGNRPIYPAIGKIAYQPCNYNSAHTTIDSYVVYGIVQRHFTFFPLKEVYLVIGQVNKDYYSIVKKAIHKKECHRGPSVFFVDAQRTILQQTDALRLIAVKLPKEDLEKKVSDFK